MCPHSLHTGHQQPEEILRLLEGAKGGAQAVINVMQSPTDDAYDASIENAIREDLLQHGRSSGNAQLQQFINMHVSGAASMKS